MNKLTIKNTAFFSTCDDEHIFDSATSLLSIKEVLPGAQLFIFSRRVSKEKKAFLQRINIKLIDLDLRGYFYRHWDYLVEYFYLFAAPQLLVKEGFKYSVYVSENVLCLSNPLDGISGVTGVAGVKANTIEKLLSGEDLEKNFDIFKISKKDKKRQGIQPDIIYFNNKRMADLDLLSVSRGVFDVGIKERIPKRTSGSLLAIIQLVLLDKKDVLFLDKSFNYTLVSSSDRVPKNIVFLRFLSNKFSFGEPCRLKIYKKKWLDIKKSYIGRFYNKKTDKSLLYKIDTMKMDLVLARKGLKYSPLRRRINRLKKPLKIFVSEDELTGIINFGDEFPDDLINELFGYRTIHTPTKACDLLSVGSILHELANANPDNKTFCWGSGFIIEKTYKVDPGIFNVSFAALRGKKTLERIQSMRKIDNIPLGDPGILANIVYRENAEKNNKIGVVAHYLDVSDPVVDKLRLDDRYMVINPLDTPREVANQISSCKYILSSSLHGLIFADSYSIPNAHVEFSDKLLGGEYKFLDYCSGVGKNYLKADLNKIFDKNYLMSVFKKYRPIKNLEKIQMDLVRAFPFK